MLYIKLIKSLAASTSTTLLSKGLPLHDQGLGVTYIVNNIMIIISIFMELHNVIVASIINIVQQHYVHL